MGWVLENLIGTKDGVNKTFTVTTAPFEQTETIVFQGNRPRRVAGNPSINEYSISGDTITLGSAPQATEKLWARYWVDS